MEDETDNTAQEAVTDNVNPSEADTGSEWDFFDPDEDQDSEEITDEESTEDEEAETEEEPEAAEAEESEDEPQEAAYADANAKVKLADGEEVTIADLISGRMMQADYSRKTQELSNQRRQVEADASKLEGITQAFVDHLSSLVPNEPDQSLIYSNPQEYSKQKAIYDNAMSQIQKLIEIGQQPKEVVNNLNQMDQQAAQRETQTALVQKIPTMGTREGFSKIMGEVSAAAQAVGFTSEDLQAAFSLPKGAALIELAYLASKGMAADKAMASAKAKAQKAPPAKPVKPGTAGRKAAGNREAMRRLAKSGRLDDALKVDFDF